MDKYKGFIYLDKEGRVHMLDANNGTRTRLDMELKQGYYEASITIKPLTAPRRDDAYFLFMRAKMKGAL